MKMTTDDAIEKAKRAAAGLMYEAQAIRSDMDQPCCSTDMPMARALELEARADAVEHLIELAKGKV